MWVYVLPEEEDSQRLSLERALLHHLQPIYNKLGRPEETRSPTHSGIRAGIGELQGLLDSECRSEGEYQRLLERNPWLLGMNYSQVLRHSSLDDQNIPDFTAKRGRDGCHDVIELKQPFLRLVKDDGRPSSELQDAWYQAERYLYFTRTESDYLRRRKRWSFENPICLLILGDTSAIGCADLLKVKQALNPSIVVVTYAQIIAMAESMEANLRMIGH